MGLCKCPKRKVTNLFCFEHRVNVCENCLVTNHQQCIVKSYLQWLQDSDYSPLCPLCHQDLGNEEVGQCARLVCYDVFHWSCLNQYAQCLPANTAPAGYTCPTCKVGIFPPTNMVSPVADQLRNMLSKVNWARAGLGLPLIEETEAPPAPKQVEAQQEQSTLRSDPSLGSSLNTVPPLAATPNYSRPSAQVPPYTSTPTTGVSAQGTSHTVIGVDAGASVRGQDRGTYGIDPRKLFDTTKGDDMFNMSHDHDEDKYKRRSALHWLGHWFKSVDKKKKRDPGAVRKRFYLILFLGILSFITFIIIMSKLGRLATDNDPFLDPLANPNIKVNEKEVVLANEG